MKATPVVVLARSGAATWSLPPAGMVKINVDAAYPLHEDNFYVSMHGCPG